MVKLSLGGLKMKVNFVRKPTPSEIYPQDEVVIEKTIKISPYEFEDLLKKQLNDRDYIKENKDLMYIDGNSCWHCIFVYSDGHEYGILINSEGSDYPRYAAPLHKDLVKIDKEGQL